MEKVVNKHQEFVVCEELNETPLVSNQKKQTPNSIYIRHSYKSSKIISSTDSTV